jgi:YidC/Oxa1 family membrane protein insertase
VSIPPLDAAVSWVYPIVVQIAGVFGSASIAIIVCTLIIRFLLLPLSLVAARGERARAALAPQVQQLRRTHAKDPERLVTELSGLYRSAGTSPFAGMLPSLLQAPFFLVAYRLFVQPMIGGQPNALLHSQLFGAPLSAHLFGQPLVFLPFLALLAGLAWLAMRRMGKEAGIFRLLPFGTLIAAAVLPLAAVLYLVATTAWTGTVEVWLRRASGPSAPSEARAARA